MRQTIPNLVDNAIKYTQRGGRVSIEVARDSESAIARVRDTGEGIATETLPRIWNQSTAATPVALALDSGSAS